MCGIAALFSYHYAGLEIEREELRLIRDAMKSRGPDGEGTWYSEDGKVGLGHRRLAVIDPTERAAQPMQNQAGTLVISFNGEIYNHRELRSGLEKKGRVFRSQSDTEVLIHLYEEKGVAMLHDLRGMFALVIWDARKKAMLLARDPYGIKPLYYADDGSTLRVASLVKALLQSERVSRLPEPAGSVGFFLMGSVPEPFTLYQEIRQVPAGSFMWVNESGPAKPKKYFSITEIFRREKSKRGQVPKRGLTPFDVREVLLDVVRHHFISDVPVGLFLSAGIDSGSLAGLARDSGIERIKTVTLAFEEFKGTRSDESLLAEEVARTYGTDHHTRILTRAEFKEDLPKIFDAMDQPTIDGVNTYFASKAAAELKLKVALSGLGGDEIFGGYSSFREIPQMVKTLAVPSRIPFLGDLFQKGPGPFFPHPKHAGLLKYGGTYEGAYFLKRGLFMPWELSAVLGKEMVHEGLNRLRFLELIRETITPDPKNDFARVAVMESLLYMKNQLLRDADWAGMAHSLEIRTPFVDAWLLKAVAPLLRAPKGRSNLRTQIASALFGTPPRNDKAFLFNALKKPLPEKVLRRAKTGFSVPMENWLESSGIDSWRRIPALAREGTPWARRWAYIVYQNHHEKSLIGKS